MLVGSRGVQRQRGTCDTVKFSWRASQYGLPAAGGVLSAVSRRDDTN